MLCRFPSQNLGTEKQGAGDGAGRERQLQMGDDAPPSSRGKWKVLIVDDEPDLRDAIRDLLVDDGYETLTARNGPDALDLLRASRYPLVVFLDMLMPGMRGDTVIETLIAERALPGKHAIILLTASPSTVPRNTSETLLKYQIPVVRKDVGLEKIGTLVEEAYERISRQRQQPL